MPIRNALAAIAVSDLKRSVDWYERLLDRSASMPMEEVAEFGFDKGGWLQLYRDARRAGSASVTLSVDDLEDEIAKMETKGVAVDTRTSTVIVKTAIIKDPDGNRIVFAQALTDRIAS